MSKSISLDLLTVIEHESRNFIWNNKIICIFADNYLYYLSFEVALHSSIYIT